MSYFDAPVIITKPYNQEVSMTYQEVLQQHLMSKKANGRSAFDVRNAPARSGASGPPTDSTTPLKTAAGVSTQGTKINNIRTIIDTALRRASSWNYNTTAAAALAQLYSGPKAK